MHSLTEEEYQTLIDAQKIWETLQSDLQNFVGMRYQATSKWASCETDYLGTVTPTVLQVHGIEVDSDDGTWSTNTAEFAKEELMNLEALHLQNTITAEVVKAARDEQQALRSREARQKQYESLRAEFE